ncbi:Solute carrier family 22 member 15, partial [Orchesella cincta]
QNPSFTCYSNGTSYNDTCRDDLISSCDRIVFQKYPDTVAKQWNLICDEGYKTKFVQSMFMAGVGVGAIILGTCADRFGRLRTLAATLLGMIGFGLASSFAHWFNLYLFLRFMTGVCTAGNILASFVLSSELVGPSKRGLCGNIFQTFFAAGIVLYSLLAFYVPQWRALSALATCVGIPYIFLFILLPESPRWLITHDRSREARQVLRLIADRNGMIFPTDLEILVPAPNANRGTLLDLFRKRRTAVSTMVQMFSWFCNSAVYYGLTLASDKLGSSIYVSTMLSGVVEIPAYIVTALLIDCIGRRIPLSMFMVLGGISCLLIQFLHVPQITFPLALFGKLCIAASFAIIYIHSAELFPTVIRNGGLGLCSFFARLGGIIAPFISLLDSVTPSLQFTVFGLLSVSSGILNLMLDETLNRTLPETLDDLKVEGNMRNERGRYARLANSEDLDDSEDDHENLRNVENKPTNLKTD